VLPRDRRISISQLKVQSACTVSKEDVFINALFLGLDGPQIQIETMSWMTASDRRPCLDPDTVAFRRRLVGMLRADLPPNTARITALGQPQWNTPNLGMVDVYLRSIEPLIAIVLDTGMR
jgi:hypothetical protein